MSKVTDLIGWIRRYVSLVFIGVVAFMLFVLFFNENSVAKNLQYRRTIDSLEREIRLCSDTLEHYRRLNELLTTDPAEMERVVREQYNMNRINEDVYVFE